MEVVNNTTELYIWPNYLSGDAVRLILLSHRLEWIGAGRECPFLPDYLPTLSVILKNWKRLIKEGRWRVGPDGMEGGIDAFKEADDKENCLSYCIGVCLDDT